MQALEISAFKASSIVEYNAGPRPENPLSLSDTRPTIRFFPYLSMRSRTLFALDDCEGATTTIRGFSKASMTGLIGIDLRLLSSESIQGSRFAHYLHQR